MGENGGENTGKLVEEDSKNIQLFTKLAKFLQPRYSPFSSIFPRHVAQHPPPPAPQRQQKVVLGAFHAMLSPFFNKTSDKSHSTTHFPPFPPIFPHCPPFSLMVPQACCSIPPPNPPKGQRNLVFWAFHATLSPFPQNIGELSQWDPFPPIFPARGYFGGITHSFPEAGNKGPWSHTPQQQQHLRNHESDWENWGATTVAQCVSGVGCAL